VEVPQQTLAHIDARLPDYINQLKELVRIPSISIGADEDSSAALGQAGDFLVKEFTRLGLAAEKIDMGDGTNPLVLARSNPRSDRPAVLIYGHYDVQGVDNPRTAWNVDPFAAHESDGYLVARGASDNKGPSFAHIKAVDAIMQTTGELPLDVVFLIEGEEENGSHALSRFIEAGRLEALGPFLCTVISDTSMYGPDKPSLTLGLRGIYYTEMTVYGPRQDIHSGLFGGIAPNPNHMLVQALAGLWDADGGIAVPGFYDAVQPLSPREKALYDDLDVDEAAYLKDLGVQRLVGEPGYSILERRWTRPTLEVNFLEGGSPRTVIPHRATAALSCRLVPDQDPDAIGAALQETLRRRLPDGCRCEFSGEHQAPAYYLSPEDGLVEPVLAAIRRGFDIEPLLTREGGSIPVVTQIAARTGVPVLLLGLGQITDNWHGPNERFALKDFHRGIRTAAALLYELAGRL
jgi:acetylornithine deacetylase/succinyl-diaminopimelate desuccinylase-like protein